jgi:hypothetical protein
MGMQGRRLAVAALTCVAAAAGIGAVARGGAPEPTLEARAVLPADTFAAGPVSGTLLGTAPINGRTPPFPGQPVQGFSAVNDAGGGDLWVMPDNGYGAKENSGDFLLRVYRLHPNWETAAGGAGTVDVEGFIQLRDADAKIPFALTRADRLLTGADFDIESFRILKDGTLFFGDEFGPFLLHTDATGKVLEAPIAIPGVKSPQNPFLASGETPNLRRSNGLEGMALSKDGKTLYPMLEGALVADPMEARRWIYEFDVRSETFTGRRWAYRMELASDSMGDFTQLDESRFLVIERDNAQGTDARIKKVYVVDLRDVGADGFLVKREVLDLLSIHDPAGLSLPARPGDVGLGDPFAFPFQTIEDVLPLDAERLLLINDNNYPFSAGRNPSLPDDNELIIVRTGALKS